MKFAPVGKRDLNVLSSFDHMIIGYNNPFVSNDHSRSEGLLDPITRRSCTAKKALEKWVSGKGAISLTNNAAGIDIDHRRRDLADHRRE